MLLALALTAGCSATQHAVAPPPAAAQPSADAATPPAATASAEELPPLLQGLDLTPQQEAEVWRIDGELQSSGESFSNAANELARSVAGAARQCKGDSPFIDQDGKRVVQEGEGMREKVLDSIQRLHRLLTPAQRKKLSDRLVEGDDWAKRERRNASRTRELGPVLDLSTLQMMQMLVKAGVLWTTFADKAEPWRAHYRTAITDFARDDFDAHHEPVATVPIVAFFVDFMRTGLRMLVPLLEPKQCEALGHLIDDKLDEAAAKAAARARAVERHR
jgi:Spy/CpxP family protein refolding chaperone